MRLIDDSATFREKKQTFICMQLGRQCSYIRCNKRFFLDVSFALHTGVPRRYSPSQWNAISEMLLQTAIISFARPKEQRTNYISCTFFTIDVDWFNDFHMPAHQPIWRRQKSRRIYWHDELNYNVYLKCKLCGEIYDGSACVIYKHGEVADFK